MENIMAETKNISGELFLYSSFELRPHRGRESGRYLINFANSINSGSLVGPFNFGFKYSTPNFSL